jgi:hypothetical protein
MKMLIGAVASKPEAPDTARRVERGMVVVDIANQLWKPMVDDRPPSKRYSTSHVKPQSLCGLPH